MSKFIAIDLDPQGIFVAAGHTRAGHAKVDAALAWDGTDGEPPAALTAESAKALGEQLRERLRPLGPGQTPVLVSIPRDRVILKELKYPAVPPTEEPALVRFQAMKELTDAPEDVVIDYVPMSNGASEGERRSMAFAVRKEFFNAIQSLCTAANLKLMAVTPRPYGVAVGLTQAIAAGTAARGEGAELLAVLTLGAGGGEFTVFRPATTPGGHELLFTRTVPAPALASEPMLVAEVRRNLTMYAGANPGNPVQALYVADTEGRWVNRLKSALGLPVHGYDPLAGAAAGTVPEVSHGRFAATVGLLAAAAVELPINFVTPRQPKAEKDPNQRKLLLVAGGAFLLVLVLLGAGMLWVNYAEDELAKLQARKAELEDEIAQKETDYKRFLAVETWKGREVVWLDMLYDLTDQFPHNTDEMAMVSFAGKPISPDPRTGKQDAQAHLEMRLTARRPDPIDAIVSAMQGDNKESKNPKEVVPKFYQFVSRKNQPSSDPQMKELSITMKVWHRPPEDFARLALFPHPSRRGYPPPVANPKDKDKEDSDQDQGGGQ